MISTLKLVLPIASLKQSDLKLNCDPTEEIILPDVTWNQVAGLLEPIEMCLQRWSQYFMQQYLDQRHDLLFLASCLDFVAEYIAVGYKQMHDNPVDLLEYIETLCKSVLMPVLTSRAFSLALTHIREQSVILRDQPLPSEVVKSLPELGGSVVNKSVSHHSSSIAFVLAITHLFRTIGRVHKEISKKIYEVFLQAPELIQYLRRCCQVKHMVMANNPMVMFENMLQYYIFTMAVTVTQVIDSELYHKAAMWLFVRLHQGDEHIAHELLSTVLFNTDFLLQKEGASLRSLTISDHDKLSSATQETTTKQSDHLIAETMESLSSIRATYMQSVSHLSPMTTNSRSLMLHHPFATSKLHRGLASQILAPLDWPFIPLVEFYAKSATGNSESETVLDGESVTKILNVLRWVHLLETLRPDILDTVSFVTKLSRLMCTFLAGSDLFLHREIHSYLAMLLEIYCHPVYLDRMDFSKPVPGLVSFYDFYTLFVQQYESVSFGDSVFTSYLLLPMQQCHPLELRRAVWGENCMALRAMFIPLKQILIPLDNFLEPLEKDLELLRLYMQALLTGIITPQRTPLPYLIAVHHINRFSYSQDGEHAVLKSMFLQQATCANKVLKDHILLYKKAHCESQYGMEMYSALPLLRQRLLDIVQAKCV